MHQQSLPLTAFHRLCTNKVHPVKKMGVSKHLETHKSNFLNGSRVHQKHSQTHNPARRPGPRLVEQFVRIFGPNFQQFDHEKVDVEPRYVDNCEEEDCIRDLAVKPDIFVESEEIERRVYIRDYRSQHRK
jgi:hypothetical protein